jgi:hypothetical protein
MAELVDVALTDDVRLPYVAGAESALADVGTAFAAAWGALAAALPGITLTPLFDALPVEDIQAMTVVATQSRDGADRTPDEDVSE